MLGLVAGAGVTGCIIQLCSLSRNSAWQKDRGQVIMTLLAFSKEATKSSKSQTM